MLVGVGGGVQALGRWQPLAQALDPSNDFSALSFQRLL
jgi:hypothetical protein